jgi:apolipoprotein N-acyltransferase
MPLLALALQFSTISHIKNDRILLVIFLYSNISFLQWLFSVVLIGFPELLSEPQTATNQSISVFMLCEVLLLNWLLVKLIKSRIGKIIIYSLSFAFIAFAFFFWWVTNSFDAFPATLTVVESIVLLIPCLLYYYQNVGASVHGKSFSLFEYWVVTGVFVCFASMIPIFSLLKRLSSELKSVVEGLYTFNYLAYCILFSCFLIAVQRRKLENRQGV